MKSIIWNCRDRVLELGERTAIMGVLNVTPDSFSDGGRYVNTEAAIRRGKEIAAQGAAIIDVGGESTRPGAQPVSADEELKRVLPVIEALAAYTDCLLSIDTAKAEVARQALDRGAHIINDVTALTADPAMVSVARASGAGVVLMHMQGTPRTMQQDPAYGDVVREVADYLSGRVGALVEGGMNRENLAVDPGIGFGKAVAHNVSLLAGLGAIARIGRPVVVGVSRKSFLGKLTGREVQDRLPASLGAMAFAILRGAHIVRVHDVVESCDIAKLTDMLKHEQTR